MPWANRRAPRRFRERQNGRASEKSQSPCGRGEPFLRSLAGGRGGECHSKSQQLTLLHRTAVSVHLYVDYSAPTGVQAAVAQCTDLQRRLTVGEQRLIRTLGNDPSARVELQKRGKDLEMKSRASSKGTGGWTGRQKGGETAI